MTKDNASKNIVFIGDSLTEWFDWQTRFQEHNIKNLGIAGEPVEGLLSRLNHIRKSIGNPDYIFIMTGINNIAMEDYNILNRQKEILEKLSVWFKESVIVVQSILPVMLSWVNNKTIEDINSALQVIAKGFNARYLDIYSFFADKNGEPKGEYLLDDGVHLSNEGYKAWADVIEDFLSQKSGNTQK